MKHTSRRSTMARVLQLVAECAPVSLPALCRMSGLSPRAANVAVAELVRSGWIEELAEKQKASTRYLAPTFALATRGNLFAAIDLGGTKVRVGLCDASAAVLVTETEPTTPLGGQAVLRQIAEMIDKLRRDPACAGGRVHLICVGVPGAPHPETGMINLIPNIAGIDNIDVASELSALTGIPTILENDANLAALGEYHLFNRSGNGPINSLVLLALGTGIGGGIIENGLIRRGKNGAAGEVAYISIADVALPAGLPVDTAPLERVLSTDALQAAYREKTGRRVSVPDIFAAAKAGDRDAEAILLQSGAVLSRAIGTIHALLEPDLFVLSGSIGVQAEIVEHVLRCLPEFLEQPVRVERALSSRDAPLIGGALLALGSLEDLILCEAEAELLYAVEAERVAVDGKVAG